MGLFRPKQGTVKPGDRSEAVIIARMTEAGYIVLRPVYGQHRYDLVIEDADGQFWRIQCKTGWLDYGDTVIRFNVSSSSHHYTRGKTDQRRHAYHGQVEFFAVYCSELNKVYLVPIDHAGKSNMQLRLVPTGNKQEKNVKWTRDYEL
jgi:hypothetical protein